MQMIRLGEKFDTVSRCGMTNYRNGLNSDLGHQRIMGNKNGVEDLEE